MVKRKGFPSVRENVIVRVIRITPYSALCKLEEYPGKEGMIHVSEVSGKWVRDIRKFVKPNKTYVVKVLRVDERKDHINLSIKRVSKNERAKKLRDFKREQKAEKMLENIARKKKISLDKAYEELGYELQEKFGDMFVAFDKAFESPEPLTSRGVGKKWAEIIHKVAKEKIKKKRVKIKVELNLKFFTGDGVKRVKAFLDDLINKYGLDIKYISAPRYAVELETDNPKLAEKQLRKDLEGAISTVKNDGEASFKVLER